MYQFIHSPTVKLSTNTNKQELSEDNTARLSGSSRNSDCLEQLQQDPQLKFVQIQFRSIGMYKKNSFHAKV